METKFFLVRHGKSEVGLRGIVQGRGLKIPLTAEGKKQAIKVAKELKDFSFDIIFTSQAVRAIDTAEIIKRFHKNVPFIKLAALNERSKGAAEGMKKEDFAKQYPGIIKQWKKEIDARIEGGENFEDVHNRVVPVIEKHLKRYKGKNLLYVIHGNVIRVIIGHILGVPFRFRPRLEQDYCAFNAITYNHDTKRWRAECVNKVF
mgnify:CR=1 FL=1